MPVGLRFAGHGFSINRIGLRILPFKSILLLPGILTIRDNGVRNLDLTKLTIENLQIDGCRPHTSFTCYLRFCQ